ncbi:MAG: hypothetical protein FWC91_14350 [Defluviitaleaceae bacterium]|nr:hypothetical protein [Defluviitaleaceae bacterium]
MNMYRNRTLSSGNLEGFNFEATKRNVNNYFMNLEALEWEWSKLNAQKGLTANYDFSVEYRKQPYIAIGKDFLNLSAKELTEDKLREYISNYYWARSILSDVEQLYIMEYFINRKYEDEIVDLLGFSNSDSNEFKKLKRSAIYKFADFLSILVKNVENMKKK